MPESPIKKIDRGLAFTAKVVPVKVKVSAAPEKGKANQCLIAFLAKQLGVKKNAVTIVSGKSNPVKQIEVAGVSMERLMKELNLNKQDLAK